MAKLAVLIGVSEYEPGLTALPGAVKDVEAVRQVLLHPEVGGFSPTDVTLLKNPDRQDMEEAIETLFSSRQKDDLVLLYFSGHGIKDDMGRLYLATSTTRKTPRGDLIRSTAVSAGFVHESMARSRSKRQVVVLDSCFSGAFAEGLLAKDDGTVDIRTQLGGEGRAVLTSSSSTEYSFEQKGEDLSIYTHFLLQGIKTGEADQDGDGVITIDELHLYASQKVREAQPAMKPEIYAIREGFKIQLMKVPPGDPKQKYRKEVTRFIHRGEISFIGRRTLDVLRTQLGLEATEAKAIEDEILEPYRKVFRENLQQYEQAFLELLERDEGITETDRNELQNFQQVLGLRNEDTIPIEAQVTARFKTRKQNLKAYEQAFSEAMCQEYPLSEATRTRFQQMRQQMKLNDNDVEAIETRITFEIERYRQNLQQYEQLFATATQQEYPLSEAKRNELQQQQQALGLTDVEIAPIEAKLTTQIETYHQKIQQYEQALVKATQCKHHPDDTTRKQLQQTWQTLGLSETDVGATEAKIKAQIDTYQANLRQYEQEFTEATEQEYPLSKAKCHQLRQRQQALNLTDEDVEPIETGIKNSIEGHLQKLQQYEQVLTEAIQFEYPLSDATREDLRRFQQVLELGDADVARIEEKVRLQRELGLTVDKASFVSTDQIQQESSKDIEQSEQIPKQEIVSQTDSDQYQQKIKQYEQEVFKIVQKGSSLDSFSSRIDLRGLQRVLELSDADVKLIEERVLAQGETTPPPVQEQYRKDTIRQTGDSQHLQEDYINVSSQSNQKATQDSSNEKRRLALLLIGIGGFMVYFGSGIMTILGIFLIIFVVGFAFASGLIS